MTLSREVEEEVMWDWYTNHRDIPFDEYVKSTILQDLITLEHKVKELDHE